MKINSVQRLHYYYKDFKFYNKFEVFILILLVIRLFELIIYVKNIIYYVEHFYTFYLGTI